MVTFSGSGSIKIGQMAAFRGVDVVDPFDTAPPTTGIATIQANIGPLTGFTPTVANALVIVAGTRRSTHVSIDTLQGEGLPWAEIGEYSYDGGGDLSRACNRGQVFCNRGQVFHVPPRLARALRR